MAIKITIAIPISRTAHQCCVTHWTIVKNVSWLKSRFLRRTSGPSASTLRHFKNTSQYPENSKKMNCYSKFIGKTWFVTLVVVTCGARTETYSLAKFGQTSGGNQFSSGNTRVIFAWLLTCQFTKLSLVGNCLGRELTPDPTVFDANGVTAYTFLTNLNREKKIKFGKIP